MLLVLELKPYIETKMEMKFPLIFNCHLNYSIYTYNEVKDKENKLTIYTKTKVKVDKSPKL